MCVDVLFMFVVGFLTCFVDSSLILSDSVLVVGCFLSVFVDLFIGVACWTLVFFPLFVCVEFAVMCRLSF